jgi:hypothetical protein
MMNVFIETFLWKIAIKKPTNLDYGNRAAYNPWKVSVITSIKLFEVAGLAAVPWSLKR